MKFDKKFFFLFGLPRSGSTLLSSILNQNKILYATTTSPMFDLLYLNEQEWHKNPSVIANKFNEQLISISEAIINGCWKHVPQNIIIDKHRAWAQNINIIKNIFGDAKLIVTTRDIPSIIASFLQLIHKQPNNFVDQDLRKKGMAITDMNRADLLWNCYIIDSWMSFKQGYETSKSDMHIIEYDDLTNNPDSIMNNLYEFLELPKYIHDFNNIENNTKDDDLTVFGLDGLNPVRNTIKKTTQPPEEILGKQLYNKYASMNLEFWRK